jgi:ribosome maturation protein SDO1
MVSLDDAVVARLNRYGTQFEILVDPEKAEKWLETKDGDVLQLLAVDDVFVDWSEGDRASNEQLEKAFETNDPAVIAARILRDGEIQLTQEQRKKMLDRKHRRIIDHITRHAWNPQTKNPHPRDRIERALEEAKWHTDPLRPVEEQVHAAMKTLRPLLPIAFERIQVAILVPAEHTGHAYGHIRGLGTLKKEEWQNDGSLIAVLEIPAGAQTEVYDSLNKLTQGSVETRIID